MSAAPKNKTPILAGVIGWPIEHSLSPLIHTIWAARAGIDAYYLPLAIPAAYDDFARAMDGLRVIGFAGVNVTIPHKEHALRYAVNASDEAAKAGAANMLTFSQDGAHAENSDIAGFENALAEKLRDADKRRLAVVLGAGGAARGVAMALQQAGIEKIIIANRTLERAQALAADFDHIEAAPWPKRSELAAGADLIVNTTSLGMTGQPPLEIEIGGLSKNAIVADIIYAPLETPLLQAARQHGCRTVDGLSMLMHQAVPGFKAWFGGEAVVDVGLRAALITELKRREHR